MLKILVASSKGGCGKSTVSTNLAAHFAQAGKNTAIVDADRQGSSFHWCQRRPDTVPGVLGIEGARKGWADKLPADTERVIVDTAAGIRAEEVEVLLEDVDALVVPVLPSVFDLEASTAFLADIARLTRIKRGKVPVAIVANRLKPWTSNSQEQLEAMKKLPFPVVAQLRDSTGYVVLSGLGKSVFDYGSEHVRSHQDDFAPLLRWIKKIG
jgi:chromosome partitioning protein